MTGMTSMLLRVLFSSRPVCLREVCVRKKKKKRRRAEQGQLREGTEEPGDKYALDNVRTRAQPQYQPQGEEIVLKVY